MAGFMPTGSNGPIKTYQIVNPKVLNTRHLQILHNGQALLFAETKRTFFSKPQTNLHTGSVTGPVVAAVKLKSMSSSFLVAFGDAVGRDTWEKVQTGGFSHKQYTFTFQGRQYCWRRTHDKALGASRMGSQDFKLLDAADDQRVLAAHVNQNWSMSGGDGRIDWYAELGENLEIMAIAVLLGLEMRIRAAHAAGAAGGGGGGGGG